MAVNATSSSQSAPLVDRASTGFSSLTPETFLKLMITQIQNQDPLEPVGNDELLSQMSEMRNLQANIELTDALTAVTINQKLAGAAALIGKSVTGTNAADQQVSGVVDRVVIRSGEAYVQFGDQEVTLSNISRIED